MKKYYFAKYLNWYTGRINKIITDSFEQLPANISGVHIFYANNKREATKQMKGL